MLNRYFKKIQFHSWGELVIHCIFAGVELVTQLGLVYMIQSMVDCVSEENHQKFVQILPYSVSLIGVLFISYYGKQRLLYKLQGKVGYELREKLTRSLLFLQPKVKSEVDSGRLLSAYQEQIDLVTDFLKNVQGYPLCPIVFVVAGVYFVTISPILYLATLVAMPLSSYLYGRFSASLQVQKKQLLEQKAETSEKVKDSLQGFVILKAYQLEEYFQERYDRGMDEILEKEKKMEWTNSSLTRLFIIIRFIPQLIIPLLGGYLAYLGKLTIGELTAATLMVSYVFSPIEQLLRIKKESNLVQPALDKIVELIELPVETSEDSKVLGTKTTEVLSLKEVSISYEKDKPVIDHLNLSVKQGEHVVLVGESGSGKSTLIQAMTGMQEFVEGEICILNQRLQQENVRSIRKSIGFIPQRGYLFQGTIAENIALSKERTREEVIEAAKKAQIHTWIESLPQGYDTMIGNGAMQLSGGQTQRISIARQILRDCEVYLMDEPTSALDEESEYSVMENLHEILKDKASLLITHRMEIVEPDDKVYHLRGGKLYEA